MYMQNKVPFLLFIFTSIVISGCNEKESVTDDALSLLETEVFYRQKFDLPEGAVLEVRLEDVSKMDVASELIASATREIKSVSPYPLQVAFPTEAIKAKHRYSLSASIKVDGKLHFTSTTHIDPFAVGISTPIEITVQEVGD